MDLIIGSGLLSNNKYTDTREIRQELLKKHNYTCNFCSIKYDKYLYCIYLDNNYHIACSLCYSIINPNHDNNLIVCMSNMHQVDIIKNSVKFIESDGRAPKYYEIDPDSKIINISMFEFCNLIIKDRDRKLIQDFKLFITDKTKIDHINSNPFYIKPVVEQQDMLVNLDKKIFL